MSTLRVTAEPLTIHPHTNADALELAQVGLYRAVVAKDAYHETIAEGGMHSGQANVVARLVRVKDGKVLASSTQHAAQIHIDLDTARDQELKDRLGPGARRRSQPRFRCSLLRSGCRRGGQLRRCDGHGRSRPVYARLLDWSAQLRSDCDIGMTLRVTPRALG